MGSDTMCEECSILAAIGDLVPIFRREDLGVALYYRHDDNNKIEAHWREGQWLWTLRDGAGLKGYGFAQSGMVAMASALAAAGFVKERSAPTSDEPQAVAAE